MMHTKTFIISSIFTAALLLSGCTLVTDKTILSPSSTSMNNSGMMMHSIDSEEAFIVNMIPHHQEAIDSAKVILERSTNTGLRDLAQNIIGAQTKEIGEMQGRLANWYPNSSMKSHYMRMMPEMAGLSGEQLDRAFLAGMIQHHQGAIQMAQEVLKVQHRGEVMNLANAIITTQSEEISMMQRMVK